MKHYKAPDNTIHAIEPDFVHLLPVGCVELTDAEAQALQPKPSANQLRRADISQRLAQIDTMSMRPARAVAMEIAQGGAPDAGDLERLATLEAEADALRAELAGLQA